MEGILFNVEIFQPRLNYTIYGFSLIIEWGPIQVLKTASNVPNSLDTSIRSLSTDVGEEFLSYKLLQMNEYGKSQWLIYQELWFCAFQNDVYRDGKYGLLYKKGP
ncbi:hypothetical protein CFP56_018644, partial [Quercus suber]